MPDAAPRLAWPLVLELRRLAASEATIAEIRRELGRYAERRALARPSYEAVRRLVTRERELRSLPGIAGPIVEGWVRSRSLQDATDEAFRRHDARTAARAAIEQERAWRPSGDGCPPERPK